MKVLAANPKGANMEYIVQMSDSEMACLLSLKPFETIDVLEPVPNRMVSKQANKLKPDDIVDSDVIRNRYSRTRAIVSAAKSLLDSHISSKNTFKDLQKLIEKSS